jgi:predicted metallo-beta-lactamase superfamily hydrolase
LSLICDVLLRFKSSYSTIGFGYPYLKSLLKYIYEMHSNIISIYRILEPAAERLIKTHRLSRDDNWDAILEELNDIILPKNKIRRST